ncbi:MAG TPA: MFS transporter [Solirubrobacteraceae bacterium]|nr:MFS transporter [Solirubrobacteraceae bacterium]
MSRPETTTHPHLRATLLLACLAQFMVVLDVSVVNVALPSIGTGLHFSEVQLQWVVNAYTVTFAGFMLLGGRAADLIGRRRVFVWGLGLFTLASLAGGVADSQILLLAARVVQGLGAAVIAPASLSIITTSFVEGRERNRAVGIWGAMGGAGGAAGVILGGLLTELSWRWIFFVNVPIGVVGALLALRYITRDQIDPARERGGFDLGGALSATAGLSLLVLGIVRTDQTGWGATSTLAIIALGLALLGVFVLIEARVARRPLMPLRIWSSASLRSANAVVLALGGASFSMWFFLSLYLQQVRHDSPITTGLAFLPMTACIVVSSTVASRLVHRVGARTLLIIGMAALAGGLALFTRLPVGGSFWVSMFGPSLLAAAGIGLSFTPAAISGVAGVPAHEAGLASGLVNTARMFGGALGLAVLATLAASQTKADAQPGLAAGQALTDGFHLAFLIGAGLALAGAVLAAGLPRAAAARAAVADGTPVALEA